MTSFIEEVKSAMPDIETFKRREYENIKVETDSLYAMAKALIAIDDAMKPLRESFRPSDNMAVLAKIQQILEGEQK